MFIYSECSITCHTKCQHFIPDFCGLSMEMANQMLSEIKAANKRKTMDGTVTPSTSSTTSSKPGRVSKHEVDSKLADNMSQTSLSQQKPLPQPQQQHIQIPTSPYQPSPSSPGNRIQTPPTLPTHSQSYQPQQYPVQSNDPRYQQQQHQQQQFDPRYQQQMRPQSPYAPPANLVPANVRPMYSQPAGSSQLDLSHRVSNNKKKFVCMKVLLILNTNSHINQNIKYHNNSNNNIKYHNHNNNKLLLVLMRDV